MMWPLLGIAVVVLGFALRVNGLLVVAAAAIVPAWPPGSILSPSSLPSASFQR
jgi:uncharacterized membrane protein